MLSHLPSGLSISKISKRLLFEEYFESVKTRSLITIKLKDCQLDPTRFMLSHPEVFPMWHQNLHLTFRFWNSLRLFFFLARFLPNCDWYKKNLRGEYVEICNGQVSRFIMQISQNYHGHSKNITCYFERHIFYPEISKNPRCFLSR